jgi:hypothetical protein
MADNLGRLIADAKQWGKQALRTRRVHFRNLIFDC